MTNPQDFTKAIENLFSNMPTDFTALNDVFKNSAEISEKFSKVALAAAEKNAEISSKWTKETLAKIGGVAKVQADPADYSKTVSDFASAQVESASEHVAAFAEVAKKVQMETVELMLAAGKDAQAEASAAVKKATTEATAAVKNAANAAKAA